MDSLLTYFNVGVLLPSGFIILAVAAGGEQNLWRRMVKIILCVLQLFIFYGMVSALMNTEKSLWILSTWGQPILALGVTGIAVWAYFDHYRFH